MRIVFFLHTLSSSWNNGNAHFHRGVMRALQALGAETIAYAPQDGWSRTQMRAHEKPSSQESFAAQFPDLTERLYDPARLDLDHALDGADLVIAHEWNDPWLIAALGAKRAAGAGFRLFFHDTHHRAVTAPDEIGRFELSAYDGVLAFGESVADVYARRGWGAAAHVWHEAADVTLFRPFVGAERDRFVFVGNWGDGERSEELARFLLRPADAAAMPLDVHGVRYPPEALTLLAQCGARYVGFLPNEQTPSVLARALASVHVPRRAYVEALPGVPTIRVFETLACGVPLLCAPWRDEERLFTPGADYLVAHNETQMTAAMRAVANDADLRDALARSGLRAVRGRHTCDHRAAELLTIAGLSAPAREDAA